MTIDSLLVISAFRNLSSNPYIHVFIMSILIDVFTGVAKGVKQKKLNSSIGLNGLIRHSLVGFIVVVIGVYLPLFQLNTYVPFLIGYFILQYVISIIENLGVIGVPLPKGLKAVVYQLNERLDESIDGKLLKIDTMVVNKQESIKVEDVNKDG